MDIRSLHLAEILMHERRSPVSTAGFIIGFADIQVFKLKFIQVTLSGFPVEKIGRIIQACLLESLGMILPCFMGIDDAMAVDKLDDVSEFLQRVANSVVALERNLRSLGYLFRSASGPVEWADARDMQLIDGIAAEHGPIPLLYHQWYRLFKRVDFRQCRTQVLEDRKSPMSGIGLNCDLVFLPLSECLELRSELEGKFPKRFDQRNGRIFVPTGAMSTNGEPKVVWLPDPVVDPVLYDDGSGDVTMSGDLTHLLAVGGFRFWDAMCRWGRTALWKITVPQYIEIRNVLLSNLEFQPEMLVNYPPPPPPEVDGEYEISD